MSRRVLAGGILHTPKGSLREACLPLYLDHLQALSAEGLDLRWSFVLDGAGAGATRRLLAALPAASVVSVHAEDPRMSERRVERIRAWDSAFSRMAYLRNLLRERALFEGADFLLSCDGDILPPPELLGLLLAEDRPWVSALVCNTPAPEEPWAWNVLDLSADGRRHFHLRPDFERGGPCAVTGACALYRRDLLERARWAADPGGEDVGFGRLAAAAGFPGWYLPLRVPHLMTAGQLGAHLLECASCSKKEPQPAASNAIPRKQRW